MALFIIILITGLVLVLAGRGRKHGAPKRTEQQKQSDELITVILPTISRNK